MEVERKTFGTPALPQPDDWAVIPPRRTVTHFPDWMSFMAEVQDESKVEDWEVSHKVVDIKKNPWYGTTDFKNAVLLAQWGWVEGAQMLERFTEATYDQVSSLVILPQVVYSEVPGMDVDIERYLEGEPQCWRDTVDVSREGPGRAVRVVFNVASSAAISAKVLMARGSAVAALVQLLELSGVRTELVVGMCAQTSTYGLEASVVVKKADEVIDPGTLAFAVGHPAMSRRFLLSILEKMPEQDREYVGVYDDGVYGQPGDMSDQGDIYVGGAYTYDMQWKDEATAIRWIIQLLAKAGVNLKDDAGDYLEGGDI